MILKFNYKIDHKSNKVYDNSWSNTKVALVDNIQHKNLNSCNIPIFSSFVTQLNNPKGWVYLKENSYCGHIIFSFLIYVEF